MSDEVNTSFFLKPLEYHGILLHIIPFVRIEREVLYFQYSMTTNSNILPSKEGSFSSIFREASICCLPVAITLLRAHIATCSLNLELYHK